jgi:EAL domain-containing protein (putative c-di-GMP-specific phosphodiesterase class I)
VPKPTGVAGNAVNFPEWLQAREERTDRTTPIPDVLNVGQLNVVFQPVLDLRSRRVFAYESLVRSSSPHFKGPPNLFSEAIGGKVCGALGRIIREMAAACCPGWPLFVNIHPNEFDEGWLVMPDDPIFVHESGVYLEITESVPLSHFRLVQSVLKEIRGRGVFLAVDDLGAGYSNLKYIADLAPEIVKLDRELVAGLHSEKRLQKLVRAIVRLCEDLDAKVVAEGIEDSAELRAVEDAGVHYGQGYLIARPSFPLPAIDRGKLSGS